MMIGLKIKQVGDATGFTTTATLRYYEQIGLLPEATRTPAGYRLYDQRTVERLAFISRAKQLGCSLEEITTSATTSAYALDGSDPPAVEAHGMSSSPRPVRPMGTPGDFAELRSTD